MNAVRGLSRFVAKVPLVALIVLLVVFMLLRWMLMVVTFLPQESYFEPVLVLEIFKNLPGLTWRLVPLLIVGGLFIWRRREIGEDWSQWEHGRVIQILMGTAAFVLAWPYATYDYNLLLDRWHALDRILIVVLFGAIWWRPLFVWPFLIVVLGVAMQFNQAIGPHLWAAPDQAFHLLILFCAFQLYGAVLGRREVVPFLLLVGCMVALHYWPSAYIKLRIGWLWENQIQFLLPGTYANGWWAGVSGETIARVTNALSALNPLMKVFTLSVECGLVLFFWKRRVAMVLLGMAMALHVGIFLISGIFFWQWIVFEFCLLVVLWKTTSFRQEGLFSAETAAVTAVIIVSSHWWLGAVALTWFDSRASNSYRLEAVGESGKRYLIPPRMLAPFEQTYMVARFHPLSEEPVLDVHWSATKDQKLARQLNEARSAEQVLAIEEQMGRVKFDPKRREEVARFLQQFFRNIHHRRDERRRLHWIAAPRGIWTLPEDGEYRYQEPLKSLDFVQVLTFFDGTTVQTVRSRTVLSVKIPPNESEE